MPGAETAALNRKPRSETRQRQFRLQLRVTESEKKRLCKRARSARLKPAEWMRAQLFTEAPALPQSTLQRLANISELLLQALEAPGDACRRESLELGALLHQILQEASAP